MKILKYYLTVSVLGKYDKEDLAADISEKLKELLPDANRNELRVHLCSQEEYDREQEDLKKAAAMEKAAKEKKAAVKKPAGAKKPAAKKKHLTSGQQQENK